MASEVVFKIGSDGEPFAAAVPDDVHRRWVDAHSRFLGEPPDVGHPYQMWDPDSGGAMTVGDLDGTRTTRPVSEITHLDRLDEAVADYFCDSAEDCDAALAWGEAEIDMLAAVAASDRRLARSLGDVEKCRASLREQHAEALAELGDTLGTCDKCGQRMPATASA